MSSRRSAFVLANRLAVAGVMVLGVSLAAPGLAAGGDNTWSIEILSSAPDQVSGGDALVRVAFPGDKVKPNAVLLLNGTDVTGSLAPDAGTLVGVVSGFVLGDNLLELMFLFDEPNPNYAAIRDTATAYYDAVGIADGDQALAAFVAAQAIFDGTQDRLRAIDWAQRAVALDGTVDAYRDLLNRLQGRGGS